MGRVFAFLLLMTVVALVQGQQNLKECPDIKPIEPIPPDSLLGTWYLIRVGPLDQDYGQDTVWDCVEETYWVDKDTPKHIINSVFQHRMNGVREALRGTINTTSTSARPEYVWDYTITGMHIPSTFMATDGGHSWSLSFSCMESTPGNYTAVWGFSSREPTIDPKLEQTLVKEIEKYAGVGADELYAVGHENCY